MRAAVIDAGGPLARSQGLRWVTSLALMAGCASTVTSNAGDAGIDAPAEEAGVDAPALDVSPTDAGSDVAPEARVCPPVIDDDVPAADVPVTGEAHVVEIALGLLHHCARMSDGTVRCRGFNSFGALGRGTVTWRELDPAAVPGLVDVVQVVATEGDITCTRHRDGTVRCWGSNRMGLLGTGHDGDSAACAPNGPCRPSPTMVPGLSDVVYLAPSSHSICAVRADGSVWCWGQSGPFLPEGGSATPVRADAVADVARLWQLFGGWIVQFRSGRYASYGVGVDPNVAVTIPPEALIDSVGGPALVWHCCYRLRDGSVRCVGHNNQGQLGNGESMTGEVFITEPTDPGLCGVRSIAVGFTSSCALMGDRSVQCWGDGTSRPTPLIGLNGVASVYLTLQGGCALRVDHSVWCWGRWSPYDSSPSPTRVEW
ncbi:MAG: hypothetical protein Q8S73_45285 [Deltaproteobacteria bacterium]|nr:hypothetical protein [Myxococcales bacterium]MDP3221383.1 hypothetical protein [Deltaproteobacteria bacterium]